MRHSRYSSTLSISNLANNNIESKDAAARSHDDDHHPLFNKQHKRNTLKQLIILNKCLRQLRRPWTASLIRHVKEQIAQETHHEKRRTQHHLLQQLLRRRRGRSLVHKQPARQIANAASQRLEHAEDRVRRGLFGLKVSPHYGQTLRFVIFLNAYECLQSGISERKQNIQRDEQKILRGVREIRQRHRASAENQVHDQHREEPNAIDEPAVDIPRSDLDDGVDDHVQRDVALVDDLPIVHAVHEDRLEAQAEEQRH